MVARNVSYLKTKGPSYMEPTDKRSNTSCCCFLNANLLMSKPNKGPSFRGGKTKAPGLKA